MCYFPGIQPVELYDRFFIHVLRTSSITQAVFLGILAVFEEKGHPSSPDVACAAKFVDGYRWFRLHIHIYTYTYHTHIIYIYTSSTAQGGGGSFKNRKPIGEIGCCESGMAERIH